MVETEKRKHRTQGDKKEACSETWTGYTAFSSPWQPQSTLFKGGNGSNIQSLQNQDAGSHLCNNLWPWCGSGKLDSSVSAQTRSRRSCRRLEGDLCGFFQLLPSSCSCLEKMVSIPGNFFLKMMCSLHLSPCFPLIHSGPCTEVCLEVLVAAPMIS